MKVISFFAWFSVVGFFGFLEFYFWLWGFMLFCLGDFCLLFSLFESFWGIFWFVGFLLVGFCFFSSFFFVTASQHYANVYLLKKNLV